MANRPTDGPSRPNLEGPIDIGDEGEIDRIVERCVRPLLAAPELREDLMPPGRRAWFEGFIKRCLEGAILRDNRTYLNHVWDGFVRSLVWRGVVPTVTEILQLDQDPDGQDERRGWAMDGHLKSSMFLQDRLDIRELLEGVFVVQDVDEWRRYPGWYGDRIQSFQPPGAIDPASDLVAHYRIASARYVPIFGAKDGLLLSMLDDGVPRIRHIGAIRLAAADPDVADEKLLRLLLEAAADRSWTWSCGDHYNHGRKGRHEAFLALERFGARARDAAPLLRAEIASLHASSDHQSRWWVDWLAEADRLVGLFEGHSGVQG